MLDKLYDPEGAAQFLGLSKTHMARWRMEKMGPEYFKLGAGQGGKIRYAESALRDFLHARRCVTRPMEGDSKGVQQ